jgi:hypothetical protein
MTTPPAPEFVDQCWPADVSCCDDWDTFDPALQQRALAMATSSLRALSGYRVGGCPVTVRPCRRNCWSPFLYEAPSGWGRTNWSYQGPLNIGGEWINMGCGCTGDCSCTTVCEVALPMPVGGVDSVQLDGTVLPASWYRVDNGRYLVWQGDPAQPDMACGWPLCQDMGAALGAPGTFAVSYLNALPVDGLASFAAGVLACEFVKATCGKACRLPSGVVQVARQGVTYTVNPGTFPGGVTGLPEVDTWLLQVNPNHLKQPPTVWWPGMNAGRVTTWSAP